MIGSNKIAVSGCSSSVGKAVLAECGRQGLEVIELKRGNGVHSFDLAKPITAQLPHLKAFIHIAWDWERGLDQARERNVSNLVPLLEELSSTGCKTVLLSTDSVHSRATSQYGSLKYELERETLSRGGSVLRAGFLWGSKLSGILKTLQKLGNLPAICLHLKPEHRFYFSNETEVAQELIRLALETQGGKIEKLSSPETVSLTKVSHVLRGKRTTLFHLPVSVRLAISVGATLERLGFRLPFRLDSLKALLPQEFPIDTETEVRVESKYDKENFLEWLLAQEGNPND